MPKRSTLPNYQLPGQPAQMELSRRESSDGDGENRAAKRARASRPKVKSGCITCKTRRVKCDETKPQCLRCLRFGRTCDGYPEPHSGRGVVMIPIKPRIPSISVYSPSVSVHATEEEHRYFQTFRDHSAYELSGFFTNEFWTNIVLQESYSIAPIRHAVIAVGALNKSLENAPGPQLKVNVIQSVDKRHHENAVLHYLKAIQTLNQYISTSNSPQLRVALISCLLFVCFETFQGGFASSVQQTYGGLKILRSYYNGKPGSRPWIPRRALDSSAPKNSSNISKALQIRLGCDNVSKERAIAMHLEEYLETEEKPLLDSEDNLVTKERSSSIRTTESFVYDPRAEHVGIPHNHMTGTNFIKEQQMTVMSVPPEQRAAYSSVPGSSMQPTQPTQSDRSSNFIQQQPSPPSKVQLTSPTETSAIQQLSTSRKRPLASRSPTPILQNDITLEEALIQTFVRLDGQGLFFGMIPGIPPLIWDIHESHHLPIPDSFPDFATAHRCWDFLMDRALQFYRRTLFNRAYAPSSSEAPAQLARQHASYIRQLSEFDKAFQPILASAVEPSGAISNPAALVITLYQKITVITLAAVRTDSEMVYDSFLPDFQYITRTCASLMLAKDNTKFPRNTRFSFDVGVVPPLHVTATRCRDPVVRREAIDLLFASPRQEGMWDGVLTARIGKWMTSCEEDGLPPPPLESRESSIALSPLEDSTTQDRFSYPSPPQVADDIAISGGYDNGKSIQESVAEAIAGGGIREFASRREGGKMINTVGLGPSKQVGGNLKRRKASTPYGKGKATQEKGWIVPEENRVQLMIVDFHIPDRYIKVKCQKALLREDGSREEREAVLAW